MNKPDSNATLTRRSLDGVPWNADLVGDRLVEAFVTLDRLPGMRGPRGAGSNWPSTIVEWADQLAQAELTAGERREREASANRVVIRPSPAEITRMGAAFDWLLELRIQDLELAALIAAWALHTARARPIKRLCIEKRWAPYTFFRKRLKALQWLAAMLNRKGCPI